MLLAEKLAVVVLVRPISAPNSSPSLRPASTKRNPFHAVKAVSLMAQHVIYWNNKAATERAKPPEKQNQAVITDALDRCARILRDLAPYQTPKLAAVIVKGDQKAPLNLSGLSDSELAFLRRTMLKITPEDGSQEPS